MGAITLYTQPKNKGARSFELGTFETADLVRGTDYTQNFLKEIHIAGMNKDYWFVKLTLASSALNNLTVDKVNSPMPQVDLIETTITVNDQPLNVLAPANDNLELEALATRPADWAINWRDKYNKRFYYQAGQSPRIYYSSATLPDSGIGYTAPAFSAGQYYETNQSRYLFWTLSDCYFALEQGWVVDTSFQQNPTVNYARTFYGAASSSDATTRGRHQYCNALRERGMEGDYVIQNSQDRRDFSCELRDVSFESYGPRTQSIFTNFVEFDYEIQREGGEVIHVDMIGICHWKENLDGYVQAAEIIAISKPFWEGTPKPPYTGPHSTIQGGGGAFNYDSDGRGDRTGALIAGIVQKAGTAMSYATAGLNKYVEGYASVAFSQMKQRLFKPSTWQGFKDIYLSPLQAIISCHMMPSELAPSATESAAAIACASATLSTNTMPLFDDPTRHCHLGSFDLPENHGAFDDYNAQVLINLPYIDVVQIDVTSCMGGWVSIDYTAEGLSGDCVAVVTVSDRDNHHYDRYAYKGNCAAPIPLSTYTPLASQALNFIPGTVTNLAGGMIGGALAKGIEGASLTSMYAHDWGIDVADADISSARGRMSRAGAASGFITGISSIGSDALKAVSAGSNTTSSNASSGNFTAPFDPMCWALITWPMWSNPDYYPRECGYPSDIGQPVSQFRGVLSVSSIELEGIDCTDDERAEIEEKMRAGVYLDDYDGKKLPD